jgi:HEAT repeat protein
MPLVRTSAPLRDHAATEADIDRANLRADLESSDEEVRRASIRLASRSGEAELLAQRLELESDAGLRESILTSLVRIGGVKAARPLIETLRSADALLRNAIIETLQIMGDAIAPEIERLFDDDDPDVRLYAVYVIQSMRSERVLEIALRVIANDPHVNVCAAAVDVLAEVGRPEMAGALRAVAERFPDHPFLGFAVRAAIKRVG